MTTDISSLASGRLFDCKNIVAVITGGGTGIGLMFTRALVANGAKRVYIIGRRMEPLEEASKIMPGVVVPLQGDVTSKESLERLAARVQETSGYINLFIANAGITGPSVLKVQNDWSIQDFVKHAWASPVEDFTAVYNVNCSSVYYSTLAFMGLLDEGNKRRKNADQYDVESQVIVTASTASFIRDVKAGFAYISSKAAVLSMTKALATFCATRDWHIRFNAICPGLFPSELAMPMINQFKTSEDADPTIEGSLTTAINPMGRVGSEVDMAGTLLYLVGPAGRFCNGCAVLIDGGKMSVVPSTY